LVFAPRRDNLLFLVFFFLFFVVVVFSFPTHRSAGSQAPEYRMWPVSCHR
jgi:hypothetical protein